MAVVIGGLSRALARPGFVPVHDQVRVLADTAVLIADGGTVNLLAAKGVRGRLGQDGVVVVPWSGGCRG